MQVFTAGWRPFIGWVCGLGLLYQFFLYPILVAFQPKVLPLDTNTLLTLLGSVTGLGTLRTVEKVRGVKLGAAVGESLYIRRERRAPKTAPASDLPPLI